LFNAGLDQRERERERENKKIKNKQEKSKIFSKRRKNKEQR